MISVVIPYYPMQNAEYFMDRCIKSVESQKNVDYEIVITENPGGWSANHNEAIKKCKGDIIKFLHMDDYLYHANCLETIEKKFKPNSWLVTGCIHNKTSTGNLFNIHNASWNNNIFTGNNTIGGPSVLTIENKDPILFDEDLTWLVDCDYYMKLYQRYGEPVIVDNICVGIGIHDGQATNIISNERKAQELELMKQRYDTI